MGAFLTRDHLLMLYGCWLPTGSVLLLPIENPLSHENKNNRQLLEKAITLEREGIFTIATFYELNILFDG